MTKNIGYVYYAGELHACAIHGTAPNDPTRTYVHLLGKSPEAIGGWPCWVWTNRIGKTKNEAIINHLMVRVKLI